MPESALDDRAHLLALLKFEFEQDAWLVKEKGRLARERARKAKVKALRKKAAGTVSLAKGKSGRVAIKDGVVS